MLRLTLDDDFVKKPDIERKLYAEVFIRTQLLPLAKLLDPRLQTVFGMDFARHRNFTVINPGSTRQ